MQKQKTVIIGAGLAGLVCGIILAKHGHRITLVEQAEAPAPVLRGFKRQGVHFDTGLHYTGGLGAMVLLHVICTTWGWRRFPLFLLIQTASTRCGS